MRLAMVALAEEIDATSLWSKRTSIVSPSNGESTGSPEKINYVFGYASNGLAMERHDKQR